MKNLAAFIIGSFSAILLASCSAPTQPAPLSQTADAYFFQPDLTQIYTYSQDNSSTLDTFAYQVRQVDNSYDSYLVLTQKNPLAPNNGVLYYFKKKANNDGSIVCVLSNSATDDGFVALKGTMDIGASWYADTAHAILATVVGKYAEYYLPGREQHYTDVVVVKYSDKNAPADNYIVRYFARDYGLILERTITGPASEVADLQLLSRQSSSSNANPGHHDRWSNSNGRYMANMKQDYQLDK